MEAQQEVRGRVALMLKDAFLAGDQIQSKVFAAKHHLAKSSVNEALRHMNHLIEIAGKTGVCSNVPIYKCRDVEGMREWYPPCARTAEERKALKRMVMEDLPRRVHAQDADEEEIPDSQGATFGERLRFARIERGMSQELLAGRCALSRTMLVKYETNNRMPSMATVLRIVAVLDCELDWLFALKD